MGPDHYSANDVSSLTRVPAATIRYYVRRGLLPRPRTTRGADAGYDRRHVEGVRLIRALRTRRRLPLALIARILPDLLSRGDGLRPEVWDELIRAHDPRQRELLDAAVRSFARHGYTGTSVDRIAAAAGLAKGSVYRAYPSKADLFFAAAFRAAERCAGTSGSPAPEEVRRHLPIFLDLAGGALRREAGFAAATARTLGLLRGRSGATAIGTALSEALRAHT